MSSSDDVIAFGEKLLAILDRGSFVSTYKYALLLALMDLVLEHTSEDGEPPISLTTLEVAERVLELYWPQARLFPIGSDTKVLEQNPGQARVLKDILRYRGGRGGLSQSNAERARRADPAGWVKLVREVEWTFIKMPLPRLQVLGTQAAFLYEISWEHDITRSQTHRPDFDNTIRFIGQAAANVGAARKMHQPVRLVMAEKCTT